MNNPIQCAKKREWWNETWNPITGCTRVSAGCEHCYAHGMYDRFPDVIHGHEWFMSTFQENGELKQEPDDGPIPFSKLVFHEDRLLNPTTWKKPRRVFVGSMTDFLHKDVDRGWLEDIWHIMGSHCPQHQFYLLTKRPENAPKKMAGLHELPNVHIGVTVESWNYERRVHYLHTIPGGDFVSVEPMLSIVVIPVISDVKWLICGAETGPGARPMNLEWARALKQQCADAGVPFWMKSPGRGVDVPADLDVMELPS